MRKGAVTAFLSLIWILVIAVIGAVIESASIQITKNKRRCDADRAIESVFAEYQRELLEKYDIFALEGTYETGEFSEEQIIERMRVYGAGGTEQKVEGIRFLTDDSGRTFREQAIAYIKHRMGISQIEDLTDSTGKWKEQETQTKECEKEEAEVTDELEVSLKEAEQELPKDDNPIETISNIKKTGLLNIVIKNQSDISEKSISIETMPTHRSLQTGRGVFPVREDTEDMTSGIYFGEYQLEKFAAADAPKEEGMLSYELEYIISGKKSDRENLEAAVRKLTALRFAPNYGYLMTDGAKKAEAEAMAATLAGVIALPALTGIIRHGILLAWAFGESLMDVRSLLSGGKVEMIKTKENWNLQLSALLELGKKSHIAEEGHSEKGLSYKEYLRMLLFAVSREDSVMRSLDVIEMNLRMSEGEFFRVDFCVSKLKVKSTCRLRREVTYQFSNTYGYQ